jgi:enediyne biosynthesis protein E3
LAGSWRVLRRKILTPKSSETSLEVRGFQVKDAGSRTVLETVGGSFISGYAAAMEARTPVEVSGPLDDLPIRYQGFAYEGAAMAFAILDGLPGGRNDHVLRFLAGPGAAHVYMSYIGVGWAMARLPRFRWRTLTAPDPLLRWLVLDGFGFHQAYFHTDRYVHQQHEESDFPWPLGGPQWYARRAIDQGVGRACWFVGGTDPQRVAAIIDAFPERRRPDLYSGAGLAATYAGGADADELRAFWERAGDARPQVAQGSAFAAQARVRAGLVVAHTELATEIFCGMSAAEAAEVSEQSRPDPATPGPVPAYEIWRERAADQFVTLGRC